jgi:hypothetical protein
MPALAFEQIRRLGAYSDYEQRLQKIENRSPDLLPSCF